LTKFLWTGESEYCICGHHLTEHETDIQASLINVADPSTVDCRWDCHSDELRPYRIATAEEDKQVIEKQLWEVTK
jgi:hypothetical protein